MSYPIYLFGYSGMNAARLLNIVEGSGGVLIDIRFAARSRVPQWNKGRLQELFGDRYTHLPSLGNVRYQHADEIQIANYEAGRDALRVIQDTLAVPLFLMCVCAHAETCHRTYVGNLLRADGFTVQELTPPLIEQLLAHPGPPPRSKPAQLTLF